MGCKTSEQSPAPEKETTQTMTVEQTAPQLLASIERTPCYGQCPMYRATFLDNGQLIYVGKRFVEKLGTYEGLLTEDEVMAIRNKIVEYRYFELDSIYPTPISDFPSCHTEVQLNGKRKKVIDRRNPPENLRSFEKFLDSLLVGRELTKVSDVTDYGKH
jgi:hypothetical protein